MMEEKAKGFQPLDDVSAQAASGGDDFIPGWTGTYRTVMGAPGSVPFRTEPVEDYRNEIGALWNGAQVQIAGGRYQSPSGRIYILVFAPQFGRQGFVDEYYLR